MMNVKVGRVLGLVSAAGIALVASESHATDHDRWVGKVSEILLYMRTSDSTLGSTSPDGYIALNLTGGGSTTVMWGGARCPGYYVTKDALDLMRDWLANGRQAILGSKQVFAGGAYNNCLTYVIAD